MTAPIRDAITIMRVALYDALSPLVEQWNGQPACYWQRAVEGVADALVSSPPGLTACFIYQSQDAGGRQENTIGDRAWTGLVTIRALAGTLRDAEALLATIPEPLVLGANGYEVVAVYEQPLVVPASDSVSTAASQYSITVRRK